jgi:hypothetical protein
MPNSRASQALKDGVRFIAARPMSRSGLTATLWAINLASISASVLVYVYLAHYAYRELQSLLISEFVLFAPMVMPVVLAFQLNQVASRFDASTLFLAANTIGAATCAVLFIVLPMTPWTILAGAGIVGTLDAVQRVARIVAIKRYFSPQKVKFTGPLTLTAQFIAGAIAGSIVAFFPGKLTHVGAAAATIALMGVAAACACMLPKSPPDLRQAQSRRLGLAACLFRAGLFSSSERHHGSHAGQRHAACGDRSICARLCRNDAGNRHRRISRRPNGACSIPHSYSFLASISHRHCNLHCERLQVGRQLREHKKNERSARRVHGFDAGGASCVQDGQGHGLSSDLRGAAGQFLPALVDDGCLADRAASGACA